MNKIKLPNKIAIYGLGKSSFSAIKLLNKLGINSFWIVNKGEVCDWDLDNTLSYDKEKCIPEGDSAKDLLSQMDLILLSPGIPKDNPFLDLALKNNVKIWTEIELAYIFKEKDETVIAITGTNGKTTTVSLLYKMLTDAGYKSFLGGNVGVPYCDYILQKMNDPSSKCKFIVLELSSFQLESFESFRPHVAAIINLYPNHNERYSSIEEYAAAKFNITRNMTADDFLIFPDNNEMIKSWGHEQSSKPIEIDTTNIKMLLDQEGIKQEQIVLKGDHNLENIYFALTIFNLLKLNKEKVQQSLASFNGIDFRIQAIPSNFPFKVFNDAKSTNIEATIKAISSVYDKDLPLYLIFGGQKREKNIKLQWNDNFSKTNQIFLIGESTNDLFDFFEKHVKTVKAYTIENALKMITRESFKGTLLFSPGFPSFDQFDNYIERGKAFTHLITDK